MSPDPQLQRDEWVLVIDDDPAKRYLARRLLEKHGVACVDVATGYEGLAQARRQPLVIVLDVSLPDISGFEVCRRLKRDPETATIPIAMLSAVLTEVDHHVKGIEAGADIYLTGAIDDAFVANIRALARLGRAEREMAAAFARERQARERSEHLSAELQRQRDQLQTVLVSLAEGLVVHNEKGEVVLSNPSAQRMLGLSENQLHGRTPFDPQWAAIGADGSALPGEGHPASLARHTRQAQRNQTMGIRRPDGELVWLLANAQPLVTDGPAQAPGVVVSFEDITQQKNLVEERQRLIQVIENSNDYIATAALDGRVTYLNTAGRKLSGIGSLEEAQRLTVADFYPPEEQQRINDEIWPTVLAGGIWQGEQHLRHHQTGALIPVERSVFALRESETGRPIGVATISRDITDRRRAEERAQLLAEATELLSSSLDVNTSLKQLAELCVPKLADWCIVDLLQPDGTFARLIVKHADPAKADIARALEQRELSGDEGALSLTRVFRTGKPLFLPQIGQPTLDRTAPNPNALTALQRMELRSVAIMPFAARGHSLGVIAFGVGESGRTYDDADFAYLQELARRAALAVDNARLYQEAQAAIRARDEVFAIATHELRTPLTSIQLKLALIERNAKRKGSLSAAEIHDSLGLANRQVTRLTSLINDLLDLSRIQNRRFELEIEAFDLCDLVQEITRRLADQARLAEVELTVHPCDPIIIYGDRLRLDQVITNLMTNAFKYGQGKPVDVRFDRGEEWARMSVRDHGIGIAEEDLARIFQRYARVTDKHRMQSLGLGLYIAQQIANAHGGHISVESTPGEGSDFTLHLPLKQLP